MKRFPGQLYPMYAVKCGMCKQHTIQGLVGTKTGAAVELRADGWARTRAWGWICPTCDKFGSTGVVPELKQRYGLSDDHARRAAELLKKED